MQIKKYINVKHNIMNSRLLISILAVPALLFACSDDDDNGNERVWDPGTISVTTTEKAMVEENNGFALSLFKELNGKNTGNENIIISPLSITYNLSVLAAGAAGDTKTELMSVLGFAGNTTDDVNALCKKIMAESGSIDKKTTIKTANNIIAANGTDFKTDYISMIKDCYSAETKNMDFGNKSDVVKYVNSWCAKNTNDMIKDLIQENDLSENTKFITLNTVYFKGKWYNKFEKGNTKDKPFTDAAGTETTVKMMSQIENFKYNETNDCQMVSLPYGNGSFSMVVMLPKEGKTISDVVDGINAQTWKADIAEMESREVDLEFPRFTVEYKEYLKDYISALGATSMFSDGMADFSAMSDNRIFIEKIIHAAKIIVDEEGTEAAAATGSLGGDTAAGPVETKIFHADHPFIYAITENSTGQIYFIGAYNGMRNEE